MAFDFNPTDVATGIPVYPKGSYELEVGEPKSFLRQGKEGKADNHGVFYKCKVTSPAEFAGKPFLQNCYMHTPESAAFGKSFIMAALGFTPRDNDSEEKFNEMYKNENWKYEPDTKEAGEMWHKVKNQRVIVDLDVTMDKDGNKQQKIVGFRPLGS